MNLNAKPCYSLEYIDSDTIFSKTYTDREELWKDLNKFRKNAKPGGRIIVRDKKYPFIVEHF